jgi:hypothetical protein
MRCVAYTRVAVLASRSLHRHSKHALHLARVMRSPDAVPNKVRTLSNGALSARTPPHRRTRSLAQPH